MHSLIEIVHVVLDKKRTLKFFEYYFIKSVLPPLSGEHITLHLNELEEGVAI